MAVAHLLLGSNQGNRFDYINQAVNCLAEEAGTLIAKSSYYETANWGNDDLPDHINLALYLETTLPPLELLNRVQHIEQKLGRIREEKWGLRVIDIDIIFYDDVVLENADLTIPHPFMQVRRFVLQPLCELNENFVHPVFNKTINQLLLECPDSLGVEKLTTE